MTSTTDDLGRGDRRADVSEGAAGPRDPLERAAVRNRRMQAAIAALDAAAIEVLAPCDDEPVFVCSVGWRSGSTLLQRILMTDPSILVWGEPMHNLGVLDHLAAIVAGVSRDWPPRHHYISHRGPVDLTRDWVAALMPDSADFRAGLRSLFDVWLAAPARRRGFARWGVKEVRWPGDQVRLLRWLYPRSRIVILARHPVDAYHSMSRKWASDGTDGWWGRWPDRQVNDLDSYGRYWNELAVSWAETAQAMQAFVIRYEELIGGRVDFDRLAAHLGLALKPDVALLAKVGASQFPSRLTSEERDRVNAITVEGRAVLRYGE